MSSAAAKLRPLVEFLVVGICAVTFALMVLGISASLLGNGSAGKRDFVEYWAAGQLIAHRANPYDSVAVGALERSASYPSEIPTLMPGNPPTALLLMLPLGFLSPQAGQLFWEMLLLVSLAASIQMIRAMHGFPGDRKHLLGYGFAPILSCLLSGQVTIFVLFGLVLFLRWHRPRPFLAGASLWFCLLKPHLFLPFGAVLLLWIFLTRAYIILAGAAAALAASSIVASILDPRVWTQYSSMMAENRIDRGVMPCLSSLLRLYVPPHTLWLQCLPSGLACVWAIAYFLKRRAQWDWIEHGSLLMLVSIFLAPYTWFLDQAVLAAAMLHGAYQIHSRGWIAVLALFSAIIEIGILRGVPLLHSAFYLWTAPAWLLWYAYANRLRGKVGTKEIAHQN